MFLFLAVKANNVKQVSVVASLDSPTITEKLFEIALKFLTKLLRVALWWQLRIRADQKDNISAHFDMEDNISEMPLSLYKTKFPRLQCLLIAVEVTCLFARADVY